MFDVIAIGDTSIDMFLEMDKHEVEIEPARGGEPAKICFNFADKIPVNQMTKTIGGNSANIAVGSRRLGLRSTLITTVGKDEEAKVVAKALWADRVDTRYVKQDKRTNFSTVINYQGERTILIYHEPREYHLPNLGKARYVYLSSMRKGWETIIDPLARYLDKTQTKLAFNPGTYQLRAGRRVAQPLLDRTDILFLNRQEAIIYTGLKERATIRQLLTELHRFGPRIVVITDGPKGSYASDASGQYKIGIYDVPVIERTGCGDAYATGFMAAILWGKDVPEAMRWGSFEAASVLQQIGPQAGYLHRKQLSEHEKKYKDFLAVDLGES